MKIGGVSMPRWLLLLLVTLSILSPIKATASINSTTIYVNDIPVFTSATVAVTSSVSPSPTPAVSVDTTSNDAAPASFVSPGPTATVPPAVFADTTSNDAAPASFVSPGPTATASPSKTTYNSLASISTISAPAVPTASPRTSADSTTTDSDPPAHRSTAPAATSVRQEAPPLSRTFDERLQQPADPESTENAVNDIDDDIANLLSGDDDFLNEPYRASFEWLSDATNNRFPDNETASPTSIFFTQKRRVGGVTFGPVLGYELELVVNRLHRTDQVEELCLPTHVAEEIQVQVNTIHHAAQDLKRREDKLVEHLQAAASDRARTKQLNEKLETAMEGIAIETIKLQEEQMLVANAFIVLLCMMAYLACQILRNHLRMKSSPSRLCSCNSNDRSAPDDDKKQRTDSTCLDASQFRDFEQPQDVASASTPVSPARRHVKQKMATAIQWMVRSFVSLIRLDRTHLVVKSAAKWLTSLHRPAFHPDTTASNKKRITSARTQLVSYLKRLMIYVKHSIDTSVDAAWLPSADDQASSEGCAARSECLSSDDVTASEAHTDDSGDMEEEAHVIQSTSTDVIPKSTREHEIRPKSRSASPSSLSDDKGWTHVSSKKRTKKGLNHERASNTLHSPPRENTLDSSALRSGTPLTHSDLVPPVVQSALSEADFDHVMEGIRNQMGDFFCKTEKAALGEQLRVAVEVTAAAKKAAKKAREKAKADPSGSVS